MDYTVLGLNDQLRPELSPAARNGADQAGTISSFLFDSMNDRGAITTSFLSSIKNTAGSVILNAIGLTAANFYSAGTADSTGTTVGSAKITIPGMSLSFTTKKDYKMLVFTKVKCANFSGTSTGIELESKLRKSTDGTTYADASGEYSKFYNWNVSYGFPQVEDTDVLNVTTDGSYNYWKLETTAVSIDGTTEIIDSELNYLVLGS